MNNKVLLGLSVACIGVLLLLVGFLLGTSWKSKPMPQGVADAGVYPSTKPADPHRADAVAGPGKVVERSEVPNPPPPPKPVANPDRVRQNLRPGKTYVTHTRGTLNVRATDKDWGVEEVVTVNYLFEAKIDREIESNDGKTIVEVRHFRDVRSIKLECRLEDVRIDLGPIGSILIPEIQGASLKPLITSLRWVGVSPEELSGLNNSMKAFTSVDRLSGKSVRLTYEDGKGSRR